MCSLPGGGGVLSPAGYLSSHGGPSALSVPLPQGYFLLPELSRELGKDASHTRQGVKEPLLRKRQKPGKLGFVAEVLLFEFFKMSLHSPIQPNQCGAPTAWERPTGTQTGAERTSQEFRPFQGQ